ncbi:MAG: alpha/beta fold hydrolase [Microvirga sp.]
MNRVPADFDAALTGFGGDPGLNQAEHRQAIRKTPVILVHGNAGHSAHPKWGMETMRDFLKNLAGYKDAEIWAMDYLGENNGAADLNDPHRNRIAKFRAYVDQVREYLGVEKMDFIAHSLGCGMVNGYLRGLQPNGAWNNDDHRLDGASTFVSLAGAIYGLGPSAQGEFKSGSPFERASHEFNGVVDDTPHGEKDLAEQESPEPAWKETSPLDNDAIRYVAVTAVGDFVDSQNRDTGRREGANLNKRFPLGLGLDGHEKIIKSQTVFAAFKDYLNANPPVAPAVISVDKDSGSYGPGMQITATISPASSMIEFVAERVTKRFNGGFIERTVAETRTGTLPSGGTLTLDTDGLWEVVFSAAGAEAVRRIYGVNITLPVVAILTDNSEPFRGSLDVSASTTRGTLYHSTDRQHWLTGSIITIDRTATVSFVAIDSDGIASAEASRAFEKQPAFTDQQTATVTQHFLAGRLTVNQYVTMGLELGFNAVVTLYLIDGKWTLNAAEPRPLRSQPLPADGRLVAAAAAAPGVSVRADVPSGERDGAFDVTIAASGPGSGPATVYYTVDGSDPSDRNNDQRRLFEGSKTVTFKDVGSHAVLCFAQDEARNEFLEAFAWTIGSKGYPG